MKIDANEIPREFVVGYNQDVNLKDCGKIYLEPNEMVTFMTEDGKEYDLTRKSWGFYATPSINNRLLNQGFKTALVKNSIDRYFIMLVDENKIGDFIKYLGNEKTLLVAWLDEKE